MIKHLVLTLTSILFTFVLSAQNLTENYKSDNGRLYLNLIDVFDLNEEDYFIPEIESMAFLDNNILVSFNSEPGVLSFENKGKTQTKISSMGRGPFEFEYPSIVRADEKNRHFYVWDSNQLKLLQFNSQGKGINEFRGFKWAWGDFVVLGNYVYAYERGRGSGSFITKYSLKNAEVEAKYGEIDETQAFLKMFKGSGAVIASGNFVYFVSPSRLEIYRINTLDDSVSVRSIEDKDFIVPKIENASNIVNQGQNKIIETFRSSSIVLDLLNVENYLILTAQVGRESPETSKMRFYVFDIQTLEYIDTFTFAVSTRTKIQDKHWSTNGKKLIFTSSFLIDDSSNFLSENKEIQKVQFLKIVRN